MEAADADRDAQRPKLAGNVHGPRKLVGLHTDKAYQAPITVNYYLPRNPPRLDTVVGLVVSAQPDLNLLPQHTPIGTVQRESVE
jgi:hypothetical protein